MATKRYYWLRLSEDFMKDKRVKKLRKIAGGDTYVIIYLSMMLKSIPTEGLLQFEGIENTFAEELALDLDEDPENVQITIEYLTRTGLLIWIEADQLVLPSVVENIGSETAAAKRVRAFRERQRALQCNADETHVKQIVNGEKRREEKRKEEIEKSKEEIDSVSQKESDDSNTHITTKRECTGDKSPTRSPRPAEKIKHLYGEYCHVRLTNAEKDKLVNEYGLDMTEKCITFLDEYIEMKGYKAKSHYLCIRKWVLDAVKEREAKARGGGGKTAAMLEESYAMMATWAEEEDRKHEREGIC